jgi:uncharacterized protein YsxB (DUF464 family)
MPIDGISYANEGHAGYKTNGKYSIGSAIAQLIITMILIIGMLKVII